MQNPDTIQSDWTILGTGAIGGLWALRLHQYGLPVSLLDTRTDSHTPHDRQLILQENGRKDYQALLACRTAADVSQIHGSLLMTTKAWQVIPAMTPLVARLPSHVTLILLHNGMGTEHWVRQHFPDNPLIVGTTSCGAMKQGHIIQATGPGETWLGPAANSTLTPPVWLEHWRQALGHTEWTHNIASYQWRKLVVNAVINPLTALAHQPNRWILTQTRQVRQLCAELQPLLQQLGFTDSLDDWVQRILLIAERTGNNYSSMERDLSAQRPTEIDFITGHILQEAHSKGLELPQHCALYQSVKAEEAKYLNSSDNSDPSEGIST